MIKRDKDYMKVEHAALALFALATALVCITDFIPFILLVLAIYPVSEIIISKKSGDDKSSPDKNKVHKKEK